MEPTATTPGLSALLWLIFVLVMIPVALRLLKRSPWGQGLGGLRRAVGTTAPVQIVGSVTIGPAQRLVTVDVIDGGRPRRLLLGVTPHTITLLQGSEQP